MRTRRAERPLVATVVGVIGVFVAGLDWAARYGPTSLGDTDGANVRLGIVATGVACAGAIFLSPPRGFFLAFGIVAGLVAGFSHGRETSIAAWEILAAAVPYVLIGLYAEIASAASRRSEAERRDRIPEPGASELKAVDRADASSL